MLYHGEYLYPSDPYRSHPFEQQPPPFQDFGTDFVPSSANSEADVSGSGDIIVNFQGVFPLAIIRRHALF